MGGGTSLWASPEWKNDPKEIFNKKLFFLTMTTAFAGCAYGFDQGNIGGVLTFSAFRRTFGYDQLSTQDAAAREGVVAGMCKSFAPCSAYVKLGLSLTSHSICRWRWRCPDCRASRRLCWPQACARYHGHSVHHWRCPAGSPHPRSHVCRAIHCRTCYRFYVYGEHCGDVMILSQ